MIFVIIKYLAPTTDGEHMPLWLYDRPLKVVQESEDTVIVRYKNEFYTYEFDKKYIKKSL